MIKTAMKLMEVGTTANGLEITKDMILNSINTFINKPIVLNENAEWKDYTDDNITDKYFEDKVLGIIQSAELVNNTVIGDVIWYKEEDIRDEFDNWQILLNDDKSIFALSAVEIF